MYRSWKVDHRLSFLSRDNIFGTTKLRPKRGVYCDLFVNCTNSSVATYPRRQRISYNNSTDRLVLLPCRTFSGRVDGIDPHSSSGLGLAISSTTRSSKSDEPIRSIQGSTPGHPLSRRHQSINQLINQPSNHQRPSGMVASPHWFISCMKYRGILSSDPLSGFGVRFPSTQQCGPHL